MTAGALGAGRGGRWRIHVLNCFTKNYDLRRVESTTTRSTLSLKGLPSTFSTTPSPPPEFRSVIYAYKDPLCAALHPPSGGLGSRRLSLALYIAGTTGPGGSPSGTPGEGGLPSPPRSAVAGFICGTFTTARLVSRNRRECEGLPPEERGGEKTRVKTAGNHY